MPPKRQSLRPPPMRRSATPLPGMNMTRSALPAEIIATILDYLPVRDLLAFARVSRRLRDMVYDDTRWVLKLQLMGVWNETEARQRFEDAMRQKRAADAAKRAEEERKFAEKRATVAGKGSESTIFDAVEEVEKAKERRNTVLAHNKNVDLMGLAAAPGEISRPELLDKTSLLTVIRSVRSIRGFARLEFGRVYGSLGPLYYDLVRARTHTDPVLFQLYENPEEQAVMLAQLRRFAESDTAQGWADRTDRLKTMMGVFENAALREFEGGFDSGDVDGRMKRYAHVLILLNGGQACIQLFVQKHPVLYEKEELGSPMHCFDDPVVGAFSLEPAKEFWRKLAEVLKKQAAVIDKVFPPTVNVMLPFLDRVAEDVISEYVTPLLDEAHDRDMDKYLKAVTGLLKQCMDFAMSLKPILEKSKTNTTVKDVVGVLLRVFDAHVDLYLQEELDFCKHKFIDEVETWEKVVKEQETATESFFMSNVNREADKRDFLSTFKKVILAPVSVIPSAFTTGSFTIAKPVSTPEPRPAIESSPYAADQDANTGAFSGAGGGSEDYHNSARLSILGGTGGRITPANSVLSPPPTTELAAKAAIMNSKLQGISTLFSLDVALRLVHMAKESLERAAVFAKVGGQTGEEAREQCEAIFVALVQVLGPRHVKAGFDKAVEHLGKYNPREAAHTSHGVAPLVTFLDLVNVGDLIQQMIEVFYEQELVAQKLTDRNDFLNPAAKEKKRFEQMLDERVAAGLNVGIDVLIDEVEHIFATTQQATDFNPGALTGLSAAPGRKHMSMQSDIGPSPTAVKVVEIIEGHTKLLTGCTDKNVLDVFNQEVGLRLFAAVCKHIKRQRISVDGAIRLIADVNLYHSYIDGLKIRPLEPYYMALRELAQIYLIDPEHAKQMATVIADPVRFGGIFRVEEVYEYATRREDWYRVKKDVERAMYGIGCCVM